MANNVLTQFVKKMNSKMPFGRWAKTMGMDDKMDDFTFVSAQM